MRVDKPLNHKSVFLYHVSGPPSTVYGFLVESTTVVPYAPLVTSVLPDSLVFDSLVTGVPTPVTK